MDGDCEMTNVINQAMDQDWAFYNAECVDFASGIPNNSIDFSVYSPPFSSLYIYSESAFDMGNVADDAEFMERYRFMVREKMRITAPGRLTAIHVKDMVYYQNSSPRGTAGIRPFSDMCTQVHLEEGWDLQCRITIRRCPVQEREKTQAQGLLYRNFRENANVCRVGMPEYLMVYRKWPVASDNYAPVITHDPAQYPVEDWRALAQPIWNERADGTFVRGDHDLPVTDVLNVKMSKDPEAEKHLCPMPLNISRRAIELWSNPGDTVLSPFGGIGSEGVAAIGLGRKFIGTELHPIYWKQGVANLKSARRDVTSLFGAGDNQETAA